MNDKEFPLRHKGETDYNYGYRVGFDDHFLEWWQLKSYTPEFRNGYRRGKDQIDFLADEAAQSNYSYERYE